MPTSNKPIAYMAADVITQAPVLRKTISDYPHCLEIETATNAIAKTTDTIIKYGAFIENSDSRYTNIPFFVRMKSESKK